MTVKENLRLIDEGLAAFNAHDYDRFLKYFAGDVVFFVPGLREPLRDAAAMREHEEPVFADLPDLRIREELRIAQGDWVFLGWTFEGTVGRGPFAGRSVKIPGCETFRFRDGKVVERHLYWDRKTYEEQLAAPP